MSVRPGLTNTDLGGTTRGSCASLDCSCGAFVTREDAFGYADCPAGWRLICGHPPAQHGTLAESVCGNRAGLDRVSRCCAQTLSRSARVRPAHDSLSGQEHLRRPKPECAPDVLISIRSTSGFFELSDDAFASSVSLFFWLVLVRAQAS